jgi:short-subunit dehydrogenase
LAFAARYGPWAIIAGASEGVGREFARSVAAKGVHCLLVARREKSLAELAGQIRAENGVECIPASIDLSAPDAFDRIVAAVGSREIGLYVGNAGADSNASQFLDRGIDTWADLVECNVLTTMRACHHFDGLMRERRRGGLLLVGSGAAWSGASRLAVYSGTKAFQLRFAESLWAELRPFGVDVLSLVLVTTDTPALRRLLADKGRPAPSRMASPARVAEIGLARLHQGPVYSWGPLAGLRATGSRARVRHVTTLSRKILGDDRSQRSRS